MTNRFYCMAVLSFIAITIFGSVMSDAKLNAQSVGKDHLTLTAHDQRSTNRVASKVTRSVTVELSNVSLRKAIDSIAVLGNARVGYRPELLESVSKGVNISAKNLPFLDVLSKVLQGTSLRVRAIEANHFAIVEGSVLSKPSVQDGKKQGPGVISGTVKDSATAQVIEGVIVEVAGLPIRTLTDKDGGFLLKGLPMGTHKLIFRLIGYSGAIREVGVLDGRNVIVNAELSPSVSILSGVVTTATGTQRRLEVGSDIVKLNVDEIAQRAPIRSVTDVLMNAQIPGVQVTPTSGEPGAPVKIRMRGIGSVSGDNDPAVIVDGVWLRAKASSSQDVMNMASRNVHTFVPSRLDDIDPAAIESIEIVRGPSATTLYGHEAANGVIVITTKRGREGDVRWVASFNRDWNDLPRAKPAAWQGYGRTLMSETGRICSIEDILQLYCVQDSVVDVNKQNAFLTDEQNGSTNRYTLNLSGGSRQITYSILGSVTNTLGPRKMPAIDIVRMNLLKIPIEGELRNPSFKESRSFNLNLGFEPRPSLNLTIGVNGFQDNTRQNEHQVGAANPYRISDTMFVLTSPSEDVNRTLGGTKSKTGMVTLNASWRPLNWMNGTASVGIQQVSRADDSETAMRKCSYGDCAFRDQQIRTYKSDDANYTGRISFSTSPNLRSIERFLTIVPGFGLDIQKYVGENVTLRASGIPEGGTSIGSSTLLSGDRHQRTSVTAGWYLNTQIGVFRRMFFDIGLRQDAGSAIKVSNAARYPKISTSWIISDEPFYKLGDWISTLRLRLAFGHAAVHPEQADINGLFMHTSSFVNGVWMRSYRLSSIGNMALVPERAVEYETGLDLDMLNDRVQVSFTYATKSTRNAILDRRVGPSVGIRSGVRKENVGRVINRSIELGLTAHVVENNFALWTVNMAISGLDNYIASLGSGITSVSNNLVDGFGYRREDYLAVGYPIAGVWKRPILGYADFNKDGFLSHDEIIHGDTARYVGWSTPRFTASYRSQLSLFSRKLTLNSQLSYKGSHVQSLGYYDGFGRVSQYASLDEQAIALQVSGKPGSTGSGGIHLPISELRFSSASVSIQMPDRVAQKIMARRASLTLQGSNLGLWTNYRGRDPSVNSSPVGDMLSDGNNVIPMPRKYALGLRMDF